MRRKRRQPVGRLRMTREERTGGRRPRAPRAPAGLDRRYGLLALQIVAGIAGVALLVFALNQLLGSGRDGGAGGGVAGTPEGLSEWTVRLEQAARDSALSTGLRDAWVVIHEPGSAEGDSLLTVVEFRVPGDVHLEILNLALTRAAYDAGGEIVHGVEVHDARVEVEVAWRGHRTHRFVLQRYSGYRRTVGRLAIILDDFGRVPESTMAALVRLPIPWTASVIPEPGVSGRQARYLAERGIPLMVHMPMEPENGSDWDLGDGAIYADTPADEVDALVAAALAEIPGATGMNNHMGSLATTRTEVMRALMRSLRGRELFFMDSRTTAATVGVEQAEREGVPWTARDIFLDDDDSPQAIAAQFQAALDRARRRGTAVIIGHPRANTLAVLQEWIPRARAQGFEFVTVDRLLRRPGR